VAVTGTASGAHATSVIAHRPDDDSGGDLHCASARSRLPRLPYQYAFSLEGADQRCSSIPWNVIRLIARFPVRILYNLTQIIFRMAPAS
jgi:hypothetical protein